MAAKKKGPTQAKLWAYDVGFGDCLLLELGYSASDIRFVLLDFGTKSLPDGAEKSKYMLAIANDSPCAGWIIAVLMPITVPLESISGPPELPGFNEASV